MTIKAQGLLQELVRIPSVSGDEEAIADYVAGLLLKRNCNVRRERNNVVAWIGDRPKLLLNSHLDTVKASDSWTAEPFAAMISNGRIVGLGANDAKGSVAAMMVAFLEAVRKQRRGVALLLSQEEETGGSGVEWIWPLLREEEGWAPELVLIGEPTGLQFGISQDGLLVLELEAEGDVCHAAHAESLSAQNSIYQLAEDLHRLKSAPLSSHPQPTVLSSATVRNQLSGSASCLLDIRTKSLQEHQELPSQISETVDSKVHIRSNRLKPYQTPENSRVLRRIAENFPQHELFHSRTMSDQVHFNGFTALKVGPGQTERSHQPDEYILLDELEAGVQLYSKIIEECVEE